MTKQQLKDYFIKDIKQGWGKNSGAREGFDFFMELSSFVKGGVILDAGAGEQRCKPFFEKSIYITQEHSDGINLKRMEKLKYDIINPLDKKIPIRDNCLDATLLNSVLEHLRYPEKFFKEAFRVLKPGGKIYISVPYIIMEHEVPYDFNRFTRYGIQRFLEDAGFNNIKVVPSSTCLYAVTTYLPVAFVYDLLQTNDNPRKVFMNILHSQNGLIKTFKKIPIFIVAGLGYYFLVFIVNILNKLVNVKPYQKAILPAGYLAVGFKPGKHIKSSYKNKEEFLNKNILKFNHMIPKSF